MPGSVAHVTMSAQDSDGSMQGETPDRSLGSISLNVTGEELDDMQMSSMDRMFVDSPAPNSLQMSTEGCSGGRGTPATRGEGSSGGGGGAGVVTRRAAAPNDASGGAPPAPDVEGFDRLSLVEIDNLADIVNNDTDWLCDVPAPRLPEGFNENDRSFLDTGLLNIRHSLLNYVTRAITEARLDSEVTPIGPYYRARMIKAADARKSPPRQLVTQDLDATLKDCEESSQETAPVREINQIQDLPQGTTEKSSYEQQQQQQANQNFDMPSDELEKVPVYPVMNRTMVRPKKDFRSPLYQLNHSVDVAQVGPEITSPDQLNRTMEKSPANSRRATLDVLNQTIAMTPCDGDKLPLYPINKTMVRPKKGTTRSPLYQLNQSVEMTPGAPIPQAMEFSPGDAGGSPNAQNQMPRKLDFSSDDITGSTDYSSPGTLDRTLFSSDLDMTLTSPSSRSEISESSPRHFQRNQTLDLSPERSGNRGSPHRQLNTTMNMSSPDRRSSLGACSITSPPANLNETFTSEGEMSASEKSRRVTRNLSYVIRRSDHESPNNNSSLHSSTNASSSDLNTTFSFEQDSEREVPESTRSSHNTSMEDLNSRVASQIRSLGCSTITRPRYSDQGNNRMVPNLDEARLVARTSSTDTYSVAHSSESPTSSGLSSPMDAQSYDDIQSSSEAVRRSMPNLAVMRNATNVRSNLAFPQAGTGQLRKMNHYISDSRLSRLPGADNRSRLRVHGSESNSSASSFNQGLNTAGGGAGVRSRPGSNTSTPAALNRISTANNTGSPASRVYSAHTLGSSSNSRALSGSRPQGSSVGNVRSTGMTAPRFGSGLRPPRPAHTTASMQVTGAHQQAAQGASRLPGPGIPVPTFRSSRIPAPGQFRFSRTTQPSTTRLGAPISKGPIASHKGPTNNGDWNGSNF